MSMNIAYIYIYFRVFFDKKIKPCRQNTWLTAQKRLVNGPYKPTHWDCAMYFSINVQVYIDIFLCFLSELDPKNPPRILSYSNGFKMRNRMVRNIEISIHMLSCFRHISSLKVVRNNDSPHSKGEICDVPGSERYL